jgi:ribosome-associated protein
MLEINEGRVKKMKTAKEKALEIAQLMIDYKGEDVTVIDVSKLNSWTDYFIIVTINSSTHWKGLYKQVKDYVKANDLEIHVPNRKTPDGDDWNLIDVGNIVVHLMSQEARDFYDLEKLWHAGEKLL